MKSVKVLQLTRKFGYKLSNNENIINIKRSQDLPTNNNIKQNIKYKSKKNNQIQNKLITNSIFPIKYKLIPQIINTNPQNVEDYLEEIVKDIKYNEYENILNYSKINIFSNQNAEIINEKTRKYIIEKLIYQNYIWKLNPDSAFLAVNIMDRYIDKTEIKNLNEYELIGLASFLIASKYEDIYSPDAEILTSIFKFKYHYQDILDMEKKILISLDYRLMYISSYKVLNLLYHLSNINDKNLIYFANLALELSLTDMNMIKYTQIKRAIYSFLFAKKICGIKSGNKFIKLLFSYDDNEAEKIVRKLFVILKDVALTKYDLNLIAEKYKSYKFNAIFTVFERKLNDKMQKKKQKTKET